MVELDEPIVVELAHPGHEAERFVFTSQDPTTKTYYTRDRAAHISAVTLGMIERGELQWLKWVSAASKD